MTEQKYVLGIDTSNYRTSVALVSQENIICDIRRLLDVKQGERGLRQSEALFQHVKNLPELLEVGENRFWVVRTSVRTLIYPFAGGEPLVSGEGTKMIKPDARLEPTSKGIKAECYDGKTRDFKLN